MEAFVGPLEQTLLTVWCLMGNLTICLNHCQFLMDLQKPIKPHFARCEMCIYWSHMVLYKRHNHPSILHELKCRGKRYALKICVFCNQSIRSVAAIILGTVLFIAACFLSIEMSWFSLPTAFSQTPFIYLLLARKRVEWFLAAKRWQW